jgi:predicted membrane-bound mannosyltransferase/DNA-binding beta-propeller fold protein YncE
MDIPLNTPASNDRERWLDRPLFANWTWEHAAYALILLIAIVSRFWDMGARAMSHDESLHTYFSYNLAMGKGFQHTPLMHGPFLFHVTALSYFLFGASDFTARLPFAIFGIVLVLMPLAFRKELGREGALAASILLLISPTILYHSRYIRQEATILMWSILTAWMCWRYLRTRSSGWLIGLAAVLALHGTDKSTSFLFVALFLVYLIPVALWQLWQARRNRSDVLKAVFLGLGAAAGLVIVTALFEQLSAVVARLTGTTGLIQPNLSGLNLDARTVSFMVIILVAAVLAGFGLHFLLRRTLGNWLTVAREHAPAFDLIVVMAATTMFMGSPALLLILNPIWQAVGGAQLIDVALLGNMANLQSNALVVTTMFALAIATAMIGVVIALWWDAQRGLAVVGVFLAISVPLFTTLFTNTPGIGTGFVGQLGYWMAQHEVMRGSQPSYYYAILMPMYEYISTIGTIAALSWIAIDTVFGRTPVEGWEAKLRTFAFPLLLGWWAIGAWTIFSISGEKMPWLTVHMALPQSLLSGWLIYQLIKRLVLQPGNPGRRVLAVMGLGMLAVVFTVRALSVIGSLGLEDRGGTAASLANLAIALAAIGFMVYLLRRQLIRGVLPAFALMAFVFLGVLSIRTAVTATYINYDYTKEFLFYAHGGPGVKVVTRQLDDLQARLGGTTPLQIGYSQETSWPMTWYMRDYPGARFLGNALPPDFESFQVLVLSHQDGPFNDWSNQLSTTFTRFDYTLVWWPMEDYKDMTWERFSYAFFNPQARAAMWEIAFNRNYAPYSQLFNKTSLTSDTWSPSHRMSMFVRNDVAAQVWDYRVGAVASAEVAGPKLQQPAGLAFGPNGDKWVIDHSGNRLFQLDVDNNVLRTVGRLGNQLGQFNDAWGLVSDPAGNLYVADTFNHRVQKFDVNGVSLFAWGVPGATTDPGNGRDTQFFGPRDLAFDSQGRLLVTDTGNKRIQVFDTEGNFITQFGTSGAGEGQFSEPVGLTVDATGNIYVADTWNKRVQVFGPDYQFRRAFPVQVWETMDPNVLTSVDHKPYLAVHRDRVYVSSPRTGQVLVFDLNGQPMDTPAIGLSPEDQPVGLRVRGDALFVTNARNGTVIEFSLAVGGAQ